MSDTDCQFFELPGIHDEIESLNRQLDASYEHLDHIAIKGPKGAGKSQFVQIAKERLWNYKAEDAEFKSIDCESITQKKSWQTGKILQQMATG
jgi:ABC-type transport system involved in cytochrome bd biosynthesis fused ATPase/permease subunit